MQDLNIAKELLRIKAIFLNLENPFTWSSGIKSPIYCDNRLILSDVKARKIIEYELANLIKKYYPDVQMLIGTATAGIAHAAIVADILDIPMGYVRASNKGHGRKNIIEGNLPPNTKVVVIEDLISTGNSAINVCDVISKHDGDVLGIASIFNYELQKSIDNLSAANLSNYSLCTFDDIIEQAISENYIKSSDNIKLQEFKQRLDAE